MAGTSHGSSRVLTGLGIASRPAFAIPHAYQAGGGGGGGCMASDGGTALREACGAIITCSVRTRVGEGKLEESVAHVCAGIPHTL
jgi:hypothetical protein